MRLIKPLTYVKVHTPLIYAKHISSVQLTSFSVSLIYLNTQLEIHMKTRFPYILALLGMTLGVFISILFGANEELFKNKIKRDLQKNEKIVKIADAEKKKAKLSKEFSKNWRYYQRYHFHATGVSGISLATLILLGLSAAPFMIKLISSYMISVGGFLYPFVWLFAAMYGPIWGRTEAKETFAIFGYMGGVFFIGLIISMVLFTKYPFKGLNQD